MNFFSNSLVLALPLALVSFGALFVYSVDEVVEVESNSIDLGELSALSDEVVLPTSPDLSVDEVQSFLDRVVSREYVSGDYFKVDLGDGYLVEGSIGFVAKSDVGGSMVIEMNDGDLLYSENSLRRRIRVFFNGRNVVHEFSKENGSDWELDVRSLSDLVCGDADVVWPLSSTGSDREVLGLQSLEAADVVGVSTSITQFSTTAMDFESKPGAAKVIYCDFDGEVVQQPEWNNGNQINAAASLQSDEDIEETLKRVAEVYAPFDVNVTNVRAVFDATPSMNRIMCVCTPTNQVANQFFDGQAIGDSFQDDVVCWNFASGSPYRSAFTISHEVGHTFGLSHDGNGGNDTYSGHDSGVGVWSPIMGLGALNTRVYQWSKGEYFNSNESEDDLNLIVSNGLSYRVDDHGDSNALATDFSVGMDSVSISGVIETSTDRDVFRVDITDYSRIRIISEIGVGGTLNVRMRIYDNSGTLIADLSDDSSLSALEEGLWQPGIYFVWVEGDSSGSPLVSSPTGWSDYGSIGAYNLEFIIDPLTQNEAVDNFTSITNGGDSDWIAQTVVTNDGVDALESGDIDNPLAPERSDFSMTTTATSVSFWYKTSTTSGASPRQLEFTVDGSFERTDSGENDWTFFSLNMPAGTKVLNWAYVSYTSVATGEDKIWVDQISLSDDPDSYADWATTNGVSSSGEGDEDFDGVVDLLEYGLLGSPGLAEAAPLTLVDGGASSLSFERDAEANDLTYRVLVSEDLVTWETVALSYEGGDFSASDGAIVSETSSGGVDSITVAVTSSSVDARFFKVLISRN